MQKVKKAIIPAAGLGTRVLPATKAMPKELLPIVDKPAIQYIVEEAVASGIEDILIITSRGKDLIVDHFDRSPELESRLEKGGKLEALEEVKRIASLCNISFIRQKEILGLGHAVLQAKTFAGGDPVAVLYGDDVIMSERKPVCRQLIDAYETYGKGVVGVKEVSTEQILKYCSLAVEKIKDNIYTCSDMIEKPRKEEILSHFAILGRCVLPPEIFQLLEETQPGAGGEIQLTDAMARLCRSEGMIAVDFDGKRYDMGNKLGIMEAAVETALRHPEIGKEFRDYLKNLVSSIDFS
ncbi:MAG: UTP--glucose-1-phosphate uridylyltransferase GalU [Clostridia bacterium]|nr:UTP--glucose-1-phosphate uridylyltransferase GalU [Clostridia bacterium]